MVNNTFCYGILFFSLYRLAIVVLLNIASFHRLKEVILIKSFLLNFNAQIKKHTVLMHFDHKLNHGN